MTSIIGRPLWQLLLSILKQKPGTDYTCDECFRMLEYLADIKEQNAIGPTRLQELVRRHLAVCPECSEHYTQMLQQMESHVT